MTNGEYNMEDIERYVLDDMPPSERLKFDQALRSNHHLRRQVSEVREMVHLIRERRNRRERMLRQLRDIESQLPPLTPSDLEDSEE